MAKKKSVMDRLKEADELLRQEKFEEASKILGSIYVNHEGATSYDMMRTADLARYTAENLAKKISDESWKSHSKKK